MSSEFEAYELRVAIASTIPTFLDFLCRPSDQTCPGREGERNQGRNGLKKRLGKHPDGRLGLARARQAHRRPQNLIPCRPCPGRSRARAQSDSQKWLPGGLKPISLRLGVVRDVENQEFPCLPNPEPSIVPFVQTFKGNSSTSRLHLKISEIFSSLDRLTSRMDFYSIGTWRRRNLFLGIRLRRSPCLVVCGCRLEDMSDPKAIHRLETAGFLRADQDRRVLQETDPPAERESPQLVMFKQITPINQSGTGEVARICKRTWTNGFEATFPDARSRRFYGRSPGPRTAPDRTKRRILLVWF